MRRVTALAPSFWWAGIAQRTIPPRRWVAMPFRTCSLKDVRRLDNLAPKKKKVTRRNETLCLYLSRKEISETIFPLQGVGGLSTYTPSVLRTVDNFEPGMFRPSSALPEKEDDKNRNSEEEENKEVRDDGDAHRSILFAEDYGIMTLHCGSSKTLGGMTRLLELKS
ncbi:hypothetical protein CEXT_665971 [Caerostris extrusa]|uniref:Uncharacterized protein n=1 Tax=Caerostris extrusa TaxID=172846 RepID=A0AAV4V9Z5_CAEEX|nr:hypothetical protein CEXT_665971 [Caerostris extrusa]